MENRLEAQKKAAEILVELDVKDPRVLESLRSLVFNTRAPGGSRASGLRVLLSSQRSAEETIRAIAARFASDKPAEKESSVSLLATLARAKETELLRSAARDIPSQQLAQTVPEAATML